MNRDEWLEQHRQRDYADLGEVEIFSAKRRLIAGVVAGLVLIGFMTTVIAGLWWMVRLIFD